MIEFKLPSLGADMDEGKLLEWKVKPGEPVKRGQVVAVVDTSKAAVEVESWQEGTMHEQLVGIGTTVPVGTVLATLLEPGVTAEAAAPQPRPQPQAPPAAPTVVAPPAPPPPAIPAPAGERKAVSPAARVRARELGVDVDQVAGTGLRGAVTLEDVEKAVRAAKPPAVAAKPPTAASKPTADRTAEMRKAIGAAMGRSKREIPHYYLAETIPMERAAAWLARENGKRPVTERLLMGAVQLKAVALALAKTPELNGFWAEGAFRPSASVHAGVAISIRQGGLIAPCIHDVERKGIAEIMRDLADLVARARSGSLRSSEMSDPTITVTNLGETGVEAVYGVIYPPQVALVGFGRIEVRPWVDGEGGLRAMPLATATLSADHRVSDGIRGARFLAELRERLQHPEEL
ncbi:MAG TPA: dihydrolipoamide acetyltransferase family protein [Usitatibacter sp.]|nr:dihydrolipoamide acetyltransferase family protein [Usitatibacter sp.]